MEKKKILYKYSAEEWKRRKTLRKSNVIGGDTLRVFCQVMDKEEILYEYSAVPDSRANLALNLLNRFVK